MSKSAWIALLLLLFALPVTAEVERTTGTKGGKPYLEMTTDRVMQGTVIAINPGEVHDGASDGRDGWAYRMMYPPAEAVETLGEELAGRPVRPTLRRSAIDDP